MDNSQIKAEITDAFYQVFPNSHISVSNGALGGDSLYIKCYLQKPGEWANNISHNDPLSYMADFNPVTGMYSEHNHSLLTKPDNKYMAYSSASIRKRNIKNADCIKIKKRFIQLKTFITNNLDKAAHDIADKVA